jgi:membrane-bound lytic murein transglycosylase D
MLTVILLSVGCAGSSRSGSVETTPQAGASSREVPAPDPEEVEGLLDPVEACEECDASDAAALLDDELAPSPLDELADETPHITHDQEEVERILAVADPPPFDIPIVINKQVLAYLDHYSNRNHTRFEPGLVRSGRYLDMFKEIFAEAGLPQDLVYMAHVESAYKYNAYSRAHAKGCFQFISSTGRRHGLRIDWWVDERSDPEKSARAATSYLGDLYEEFGDWYLALAAYNGGEGRVRRAIARSGSKDFWKLQRYLRRETRNYVPAIIAATLISKEPGKYGFEFQPDPPLVYETIEVEGAVDLNVLARCAGSDFETLKKLNPALRRYQTPPDGPTDVRVPVGLAAKTLAALAEVPKNERVLYARHRVRRGDTLYDLARAYGVSVSAIQKANNMGRRTMIREGKVLVIPTVAAQDYLYDPSGAVASKAHTGSGPVSYKVRRGDTLSGIARRYGTTANAIAAASGISVRKTLQIGERLEVWPGVRSTSEVRRLAQGGGTSTADGGLVHTVRRGDTLWRIASTYNTSVDRLCSMNNLSRHQTIYPGMKLTVR